MDDAEYVTAQLEMRDEAARAKSKPTDPCSGPVVPNRTINDVMSRVAWLKDNDPDRQELKQ